MRTTVEAINETVSRSIHTNGGPLRVVAATPHTVDEEGCVTIAQDSGSSNPNTVGMGIINSMEPCAVTPNITIGGSASAQPRALMPPYGTGPPSVRVGPVTLPQSTAIVVGTKTLPPLPNPKTSPHQR